MSQLAPLLVSSLSRVSTFSLLALTLSVFISVGLEIAVFSIFVNVISAFNEQNGIALGWVTLDFDQYLVLLGLVIVLTQILRIYTLSYQNHISVEIGAVISKQVFKGILRLDYQRILELGESEMYSVLERSRGVVSYLIAPLINICVSLVISTAIFLIMLFYALGPAVALLSVSALIVIGLYIFQAKKLRAASNEVALSTRKSIRKIQEALGEIRAIKLRRAEDSLAEEYHKTIYGLQAAVLKVSFLSIIPRYIIEALFFIGLLIFAYVVSTESVKEVEHLSIAALGLVRLIPYLHQTSSNLAILKGSFKNIQDIKMYNQRGGLDCNNASTYDCGNEVVGEANVEIVFDNVSYQYPRSTAPTFQDVSFRWKATGVLGVRGPSGCGKSTLIDLVSGIIKPTSGKIDLFINGCSEPISPGNKEWQASLCYLPQKCYLPDRTVLDLCGVDIHNAEAIRLFTRLLDITGLVNCEAVKDNLTVGEDAAYLSGGQKQRVALVRALCARPRLLIMDESLSAVEPGLEQNIITRIRIEFPDLPLIIISHRAAAYELADQIIDVK